MIHYYDTRAISKWEEPVYGLRIKDVILFFETNKSFYAEQEGVYFSSSVIFIQEYFDRRKPQKLKWTTSWEESSAYYDGIDNIVLTSIYDLHITPW